MNNTIKLIIEIPKEDYERYKKTQNEFDARESIAINSIVHGIPLNDIRKKISEYRNQAIRHNNLSYAEGLQIAEFLLINIINEESE